MYIRRTVVSNMLTLMLDKYYLVGTGLSIKELRGLGLFLQVRRSVGADSVMHYDGPVKMLDPANLNSMFTSFRSGCFTNRHVYLDTVWHTECSHAIMGFLDKQGNY
jgi:hypothetical protein